MPLPRQYLVNYPSRDKLSETSFLTFRKRCSTIARERGRQYLHGDVRIWRILSRLHERATRQPVDADSGLLLPAARGGLLPVDDRVAGGLVGFPAFAGVGDR